MIVIFLDVWQNFEVLYMYVSEACFAV